MKLADFFDKFKDKLSERKKYFLAYTVCFSIAVFIIYFWFIISHRTFIWLEDGWQQHYKALIYYSEYLRSIIKNLLFQHKLIIPNWDFCIGEGGDILTTLHYYTIGDPLSVFSIFFTRDNMYVYYDIAIILRMFLSGITFSYLCFGTGKKNNYAILSGALAYSLCGWAIYAKVHPYFINPMIYFPLLILGIEKIIQKKRPYLFIISVAVSLLSNFYFFYMLVILTVIYVIVRSILLYGKNIKEILFLILRIGGASVLGVMMAGVIFLPLSVAFLGDSRLSESYNIHLLYPLSYYSKLPGFFITSGRDFYTCIALAIPILLAVFIMFHTPKKYRLHKILFVICAIMVTIPVFAKLFNGFTYAANRWVWAFSMLCAYILVTVWPTLTDLSAKEGMYLIKCLSAYFVVCLLFEYSSNKKAFSSIILGFILLCILMPLSVKSSMSVRKKEVITLIIVITSVIINDRWGYSLFDDADIGAFLEVRQLALNSNETTAVSAAAAAQETTEHYRFSGRSLTKNANMISGISSTEFYWSLSNPNIEKYRSSLDILENRSFDPCGYDDRAALNSLASVLYYAIPQNDSSPAPYGFTYIENLESGVPYKVYKNENALPLAYTYDNYMTEDEWKLLTSAGKEEAMLQSAVLSENAGYTAYGSPKISSYEISYEISCNSDDVTLQGNNFVVTSPDASVSLNIETPPDSEIFVCLNGLDFKETSRYDLYFGDENLDPLDLYDSVKLDNFDNKTQMEMKKEKLYWSVSDHPKSSLTFSTSNNETKVITYTTKDYDFYGGRHNFAANLFSGEDGLSSVNIAFQLRGVYSFDSLKVICQPMDNYVNQINKLKENTLKNMTISTDTVTGNITLDSPSLLCFSIPYSKGWQAYVDGNKAKIYQANIMHMALDLDAGSHEIKLVYKTPLLREGLCISFVGLAIFIALIIVNEKRIRASINAKNRRL